jgi:UDP-N-acetylmuramate dehydrogenase
LSSLHTSEKIEGIFSKMLFDGERRFMEPMRNHSSLKIGGPADIFIMPHNPSSLKNLLITLKREEIPYFPLGGGTNVLIKDGGIEGAVISLKALNSIEVLSEDDEYVYLHGGAGIPLQKLVAFSREHGYAGLEWLVGIPGLLGGAICGNAGAFGSEIKDILSSVWLMDANGTLNRFRKEDIHFGYRTSSISIKEIIVSGELRLRKDTKEALSSRIEQFIREKRERQPISEPSVGCVFKNPPGISAGKLIDETGCKGMSIGDIEVSRVHANFFINRGQGTASDFLQLMGEVTQRVTKHFGIILEPEIKIVGREHVNG